MVFVPVAISSIMSWAILKNSSPGEVKKQKRYKQKLSPPQRLKGLFSGGVDPLSNVSAGTELDFAPAIHLAQRIDITNAWTSAEEREAEVPKK